MLTRTKIALSAAIILGSASAAFAGDHNLATELQDSGRIFGQAAPVYASALTGRVVRNAPVATMMNASVLADRQSAWYRL